MAGVGLLSYEHKRLLLVAGSMLLASSGAYKNEQFHRVHCCSSIPLMTVTTSNLLDLAKVI